MSAQGIEHMPDHPPVASLAAFLVTCERRLLLRCASPVTWCTGAGYTMIAVGLPGGDIPLGLDMADTLAVLAYTVLGPRARVNSIPQVFGPSSSHRTDRLKPDGGSPVPLLRFARPALPDDAQRDDARFTRASLREIIIRVYHAALPEHTPPPDTGWLWLTPDALRRVMRGTPLADLRAITEYQWLSPPTTVLPDDVFLFTPSDFGERHLL